MLYNSLCLVYEMPSNLTMQPNTLENKLFFTKSTVTKVEKLLNTLKDAIIEFDTAQWGNKDYKPDDTGLWMQSYKRIRDDFPPILEDLESEFRGLLGFADASL